MGKASSIMVEEKIKKTLKVEIPAKTFDRLQEYSENTNKSVQSIVDEAINDEITSCEVRGVLSDKCEGSYLPKNSRVCRAVAKGL